MFGGHYRVVSLITILAVCAVLTGVASGTVSDAPLPAQFGNAERTFPDTVVGESSTLRLGTIARTENTVDIYPTCSLSGSGADQFRLVTPTGPALGPGEAWEFDVVFEPTSVGEKRALLTCVGGDSVVRWTLVGTGVVPLGAAALPVLQTQYPVDDTVPIAVGTGAAAVAAVAVAFDRLNTGRQRVSDTTVESETAAEDSDADAEESDDEATVPGPDADAGPKPSVELDAVDGDLSGCEGL